MRGISVGNNPISAAARELRRKQTEAEKRLWFKLRDGQLCSAKFRRQAVIGNFVADFVCFEKKLVLEIDGSPHKQTDVKLIDKQRTEWLQSERFKVIRFWNAAIFNDLESVIKKIKANLKP